MPDIAAVVGALTGVKNAIDIARFLKDSKPSLDNAENQLKLADLIHALAEARVQIAEIQEVLIEKDQKIKELEEAFQSKDVLVKFFDAYHAIGPDGKAIGDPYCMHCWEVDHKKYHLHTHIGLRVRNYMCSTCKNTYTIIKDR